MTKIVKKNVCYFYEYEYQGEIYESDDNNSLLDCMVSFNKLNKDNDMKLLKIREVTTEKTIIDIPIK